MVQTAMLPLPEMDTAVQLDQIVYTFIDATTITVLQMLVHARPQGTTDGSQ